MDRRIRSDERAAASQKRERERWQKRERNAKEEKRRNGKKKIENDIVRNYFLGVVSQEFRYAEGKLCNKVRRTIERKVEKREGREERVCVHVIYMAKAATYLHVYRRRES